MQGWSLPCRALGRAASRRKFPDARMEQPNLVSASPLCPPSLSGSLQAACDLLLSPLEAMSFRFPGALPCLLAQRCLQWQGALLSAPPPDSFLGKHYTLRILAAQAVSVLSLQRLIHPQKQAGL